jgi:ABC-type nitrate/sulfonate/bicarbonate transport system permease component
MPTRHRALLILVTLTGLALLSIALSLMAGSIAVSPAEVFSTLFNDGGGIAGDVVRSLRLPRALAGFACGGLLALAGALLQVLLRNPLADPTTPFPVFSRHFVPPFSRYARSIVSFRNSSYRRRFFLIFTQRKFFQNFM